MKLRDLWVLNRLPKPDPQREEELHRQLEEEDVTVGWKDTLAMLLAAFVTLVLPCALLLAVLGGLVLGLMALL